MRLVGVGVYNLSKEENRQLTIFDILEDREKARKKELKELLDSLGNKYHLDFAGHLDQIYRLDTLHKTVEYMRKHT